MIQMSFGFYVNKIAVEMREKSSISMIMQNRYNNANAWDKVLAKLDHLTDREPIFIQRLIVAIF